MSVTHPAGSALSKGALASSLSALGQGVMPITFLHLALLAGAGAGAAEAPTARNIPAQGKRRCKRAPPWVLRAICPGPSALSPPIGEADWGRKGMELVVITYKVARW